jgi:hypothetical protein
MKPVLLTATPTSANCPATKVGNTLGENTSACDEHSQEVGAPPTFHYPYSSDKNLTVQRLSGDVRRFGWSKNQGLTEIKARRAPPERAVLGSSPTSGAILQRT